MRKKNVVAICGSTRQHSINHYLIKAMADLSAERLDIIGYNGIANLPQFNPDKDVDPVAKEVADFRQQLDHADGIIICTPEYAHGIPGALKNAIDWTISSCQFPHKPTMLVTASTDGKDGHSALLRTLKAIEAKNIDNLHLVIPFAKTKISTDNTITDINTLQNISDLIGCFIKTIDNSQENSFTA